LRLLLDFMDPNQRLTTLDRKKLTFVLLLFLLVVVLLMTLSLPYFQADRIDPVEIEPRFLAVDSSLHAGLENMELGMGQADEIRQIFTEFEEEWERNNNLRPGFVGSVIRDHEGRFRMYYELRQEDQHSVTAVALSEDGLNWTKPDLNQFAETADHPAANLIRIEPHSGMYEGQQYDGAHVFYDENAPPESRYKLAWHRQREMYVATSSDGFHFETQGMAWEYKADTNHSVFFDSLRQEYVMYGRVRGGEFWQTSPQTDRRGVVLHRSESWSDTPWPDETTGQIILDPMEIWDYDNPVKPDIYAPNIQEYHGQYIGLPPIFFRDDRRVPVKRPDRTTGPIYPVFMYSKNGVNWTFPDKDHPVIDLSGFEPRMTRKWGRFIRHPACLRPMNTC